MKAGPGHTLRVGYNGNGYVEERLLKGLPYRSVELIRKRDFFNALAFVRRKFNAPPNATSLLGGLHQDFGLADVSLFHLLNRISLASTPWVATYEHYLPRWNWDAPLGWRHMAAPPCKKLIAISQWAQRFQESLLARHPEIADIIRTKMCVITPGQQLLINEYDEKVLDTEIISFAFVGGDFFRKGGMEVLEVFAQLVARHFPLHLTIVSGLAYGDYASHTTEEDYQRALALIDQMGRCATHIHYLKNDQVLELLTRTHVSLLPTYDDTYGFSVLEAQAAGCPVITTDGCALPEVNDDLTGWVIKVPKDEHNIPRHRTREERDRLSASIREDLLRIVQEICERPSTIPTKGRHALERIRRERRLEDRAALLESIYAEAAG